MFPYNTFLILWIICLVIPVRGEAHGVKGSVSNGSGALLITAQYDGHEPMSYAKATVRAPGGPFDFQTGRTDRNGRFCFFPDVPGNWEVIVDDGVGHRLKLLVPVKNIGPGAIKIDLSQDTREIPLYQRAIAGLGFIFGIAGCLLWLTGRQRGPRKSDESR